MQNWASGSVEKKSPYFSLMPASLRLGFSPTRECLWPLNFWARILNCRSLDTRTLQTLVCVG